MEHHPYAQHVLERLDHAGIELLRGRFQSLRQIGIGCVNLSVLFLAYAIHQSAVAYERICQYLQQAADRLVTFLHRSKTAIYHGCDTSKELCTAWRPINLETALHNWIVATQRNAHIARPRSKLYPLLAITCFVAAWCLVRSYPEFDLWTDDEDCEPCGPTFSEDFHSWQLVADCWDQTFQALRTYLSSPNFNHHFIAIVVTLITLCCFLIEAAVRHDWITIKGSLDRFLPSRETFYLPQKVTLLGIYLIGFQIPSIFSGTFLSIMFSLTVCALITFSISLFQPYEESLYAKDKILEHLETLLFLVPNYLMNLLSVHRGHLDLLRLQTINKATDYMSFGQGVNPHLQVFFTIPLWLRNPYVAVLCSFGVGCMLRYVFYAVCMNTAGRVVAIATSAQSHWDYVTIRLLRAWTASKSYVDRGRASLSSFIEHSDLLKHHTFMWVWGKALLHSFLIIMVVIFSLLLAAWPSNLDFAHIVSTLSSLSVLEDTFVFFDVNFLSILFSCMQTLSPARIWIAQKLVNLGKTIENASFNGMQWFWVSKFVWLDGSMITVLNAAVWCISFFVFQPEGQSTFGDTLSQ